MVKVGRPPGFSPSIAHTRICDQRQHPDMLPQKTQSAFSMAGVFLIFTILCESPPDAADNHAL